MPAKCQHRRIGNHLALPLILVGGRIEVTRRTLATTFTPDDDLARRQHAHDHAEPAPALGWA
jgi:hypothetical protein